MFLVHSGKKRYGNLLICEVKNEYTQGSEMYPQTLRAAFAMLINYKPANIRDMRGLNMEACSKM